MGLEVLKSSPGRGDYNLSQGPTAYPVVPARAVLSRGKDRPPANLSQGINLEQLHPGDDIRRHSLVGFESTHGSNGVRLPQNGNFIRIFQLEVNCKRNDDPIRGDMRIVDLNHDPEFAALSYAWGDPSDYRWNIQCGQHTISVPWNCIVALRNLRRRCRQSICIWVDAICINQADAVEKSRQILLMGRIFSAARVVYVDLGPGGSLTDDAIRSLNRYASVESGWFSNYLYCRLAASGLSEKQDAAFRALFMHPWITRNWTLQEILLSRDATVICGKRSIAWRDLEKVLSRLEAAFLSQEILPLPAYLEPWLQLVSLCRQLEARRKVDGSAPVGTLKRLSDQAELAELSRFADRWTFAVHVLQSLLPALFLLSCIGAWLGVMLGFQKTLWWVWFLSILLPLFLFYAAKHLFFLIAKLISWPLRVRAAIAVHVPATQALAWAIATRSSTEAKDKFFGARGILLSRDQAVIDYDSSSLEDAFRTLTTSLLDYTGSLDSLIFTSDDRLVGAPSWVVDWSSVNTFWARLQREDSRIQDPTSSPKERARTAEHPTWRILDGRILVVRARIVGTIDRLYPTMSDRDVHYPITTRRNIVAFQNLGARCRWDFHDWTAGLPRSVLGLERHHDGFHRALGDWAEAMMRNRISHEDFYGQDSDGMSTAPKWSWVHHALVEEVSRNGVLASLGIRQTSQELYLATIAPRGARVGDLVVAVRGCAMPFVLREDLDGGYHIFVGPIYSAQHNWARDLGAEDDGTWDEYIIG